MNVYPRTLHVGESVYNYDNINDDLKGVWTIEMIDNNNALYDKEIQDQYTDESTIVLLTNEDGSTNEVFAYNLYKIDDNLTRLNGELVCFEHDVDIDYPYYLPDRDENYYSIELKTFD